MSRSAMRSITAVAFPLCISLTAMLYLPPSPSLLDEQARSSVGSRDTISRMAGSPVPPGEARILRIIPEPIEGSRTVMRRETGTVIFRGRSELNLHCGNCQTLLAAGVASGQLLHIVLLCSNCGSFNDTETCTSANKHKTSSELAPGILPKTGKN